MFQPKKPDECLGCIPKHFEIGQTQEKSRCFECHKETANENPIECMTQHLFNNSLVSTIPHQTHSDLMSSTPVFLHTNRNQIYNDKLTIYKNHTQNISCLKTLPADSTINEKDCKPFWNTFTKDMSDQLWSHIKIDSADLDMNCWNKYSNVLTQNSWFTMKTSNITTKPTNFVTTCWPSQRFLWQDIMENEQLKIERDDVWKQHKLSLNLKRKKINQTTESNKKRKIYDSKSNTISIQKTKTTSPKKPTVPLKTHLFRLNCTRHEKQTLKQWFGAKRWTYNKCVDTLQNGDHKLKDISRSFLRSQHVNNTNFKPGGFHEDCPWALHINYDLRDDGLCDFWKALNNEKAKRKKNSNYTFKMKFQSRRDNSQSITIRKRQFQAKSGAFSFLKDIKTRQPLPKYIEYDFRIVLKDTGEVYFAVPVPINIQSENQAPVYQDDWDGVIALDPGVRTFMTGFEASGKIHEWGRQDINRIVKLCKHMDHLQSKFSNKQRFKSKQRTNMKRAWKRMRNKIRNLINNIHKNLAKWLCQDFRVVLLPKFNVKYMVKKKDRNIHSKTVRSMLTWGHFRFRQRLLNKTREYMWNQVIICDEAYTSKTCCCCGTINAKLGGNKVFTCVNNNCGFQIDRDVNGAINILLRYLTLQNDRLELINNKFARAIERAKRI